MGKYHMLSVYSLVCIQIYQWHCLFKNLHRAVGIDSYNHFLVNLQSSWFCTTNLNSGCSNLIVPSKELCLTLPNRMNALQPQSSTGWWWLEHRFYFSLYWECHHPNWRSHIFQMGGSKTNQSIITSFHIAVENHHL